MEAEGLEIISSQKRPGMRGSGAVLRSGDSTAGSTVCRYPERGGGGRGRNGGREGKFEHI